MTGTDVVAVATDIDNDDEDDDAIVGNVMKPFIGGLDIEMLLGRGFRPFAAAFFFGDFGPDDVGDVIPIDVSASLFFRDGIDADGGP